MPTPRTPAVHIPFADLFLAGAVALAVVACGDGRKTGGAADAAVDAQDDAPAADAASDDARGPDASGHECTFNRDCPESERCACELDAGCFCEVGPRGTGVVGEDTCESGNDCTSSVCVEGPSTDYYCSDECDDGDDCGGALPICSNIALLGKICVRALPD